jgi:hypothetical protein
LSALVSSPLISRADAAFFAGQYREAHRFFSTAACLNPNDPIILHRIGIVFANLRDWNRACQFFFRAVTLDPLSANSILELGKAFLQADDVNSAQIALKKFVSLAPDLETGYLHFSQVIRKTGGLDPSSWASGIAFSINPSSPEVLAELGYSLREKRLLEQCIDIFGKSAAIAPNQPDVLLSIATCELGRGNFGRGWRLFDFRWRFKDFLKYHRDYPFPRWSGCASIKGRKLLLFSEQGYGDTIQFLRFVDELSFFEAEITLLVPKELERLCVNVGGVKEIVSRVPDDAFVACCSLMSLPAILKTTIDSIPGVKKPYIRASTEHVAVWQARLSGDSSRKIGFCWDTSANPFSRNRGIPLNEASRIFLPGLRFVSLRKDSGSDDVKFLLEHQAVIDDVGHELSDFSITAGLVELLDLVVTVDTSVAHLAGAMGKEVWIILPKRADWRWLEDRSDSPWYPRARLFRQTIDGDWSGPLNEVATALAERYGLEARA